MYMYCKWYRNNKYQNRLAEPCEGCEPPYGFKNHMPLNVNTSAFSVSQDSGVIRYGIALIHSYLFFLLLFTGFILQGWTCLLYIYIFFFSLSRSFHQVFNLDKYVKMGRTVSEGWASETVLSEKNASVLLCKLPLFLLWNEAWECLFVTFPLESLHFSNCTIYIIIPL